MIYRANKISINEASEQNNKILTDKLKSKATYCISTMYCPNCGQGWTDSICMCAGLQECLDCGWKRMPTAIAFTEEFRFRIDKLRGKID